MLWRITIAILTLLPVGCGNARKDASRPPANDDRPAAESRDDDADPNKKYVEARVMYATNRQENLSASKVRDRYGNRDGGKILFGEATVSIPFSHEKAKLERPWLFFPENPNKHIVLLDTQSRSEQEFQQEIADIIRNASDKSMLVFVHGFNVSFEDAAHRSAQLAYDLRFDGAVAFFSWPSNGKLLDYVADIDEMRVAWRYMREFFQKLADNPDIDEINVIAHSMGSRGVAQAFETLLPNLDERRRSKFRQFILTAPEISIAEFNQIAPLIVGERPHITLYASSVDVPLKYSEGRNQYSRLGQVINGKPFLIDGIDSIDATTVIKSFTGHSYIFDERELINDLHGVLKGEPPEERIELRVISRLPRPFYGFRP